MKKFTLSLTFLVFAVAFLNAQTTKVTIQVNMNQIADKHRGGDVWVYMDSNWSEYYTMTADDNDSIYSYTVEKDAGSTLTYSFSYQTGPNSDNDYVVEMVPYECANGSGFREITVPSNDTTLVAVSYGSCYETGITLRVNLSEVTDMYEGGDVWVYMDANWNEYYTMTDDNGDGIYDFTLMKDPGTTLYYSFSYQNGADPNNDYVTEVVPASCAADDGFRELAVTAGDIVLPAFSFGSCDEIAPPMVNITFQVDMSNETVVNNDVQVVIKNPWIWTALTDQGNGIWSGTVEVNPDNTYPYTFVNGGQDVWEGEESVPAGCNYGTESAPERHVTVMHSDTSLVLTAFGECVNELPTSNVTFQVDMNQIEDLYEGGDVWVYMDANWNEYYTMTDDNGDGIYDFTLMKDPGTTLYYSFSYQNGADPNNDYVTEIVPTACAADNNFREHTVTAGDTELPAFLYGSCDEATPSMVNITFQVDMSNETVVNNDIQVVIKNPWIWTALTDQGNGIWSGTVEVESDNIYPYTFVNGGQDVWEGEESVPEACNMGTESAPERHITVEAADTILAVVDFGSCGSSVSVVNFDEGNVKIYPNPANHILNISVASGWVDSYQIIDMTGRIVVSKTAINNRNVLIEVSSLDMGIYSVITKSNEATTVTKIIISR